MQVPFVDLKAQYLSIKDDIDLAMQNVILESAFIKGKYVKAFEVEFARTVGVKYCIGVANGTDGLFLTLKALGIGKGDEVITTANSFIATSEAISHTGAQVVFVDCEPTNYTIDIGKIETKISERTKAIVPVHLYGQPADMDAIRAIALKYNLLVIEDAAQAHLAACRNVEGSWSSIGTLGNAAVFSFYPGKNLGAYGDGGAVCTNDQRLAEKIEMWANHGRLAKYNHEFEGYNSRLDGLQAAILSVKLTDLGKWTEKRRAVAQYYYENLNIEEICLPKVSDKNKHVYHLFVIQTEQRDALAKYLKAAGVQTGVHYPIPLPHLPAYRYLNYQSGDFPVSEMLAERILSLPIYPEIGEDHLKYVCDTIKAFFAKGR